MLRVQDDVPGEGFLATDTVLYEAGLDILSRIPGLCPLDAGHAPSP